MTSARYEKLKSEGAPAELVENERRQQEEATRLLAALDPSP